MRKILKSALALSLLSGLLIASLPGAVGLDKNSKDKGNYWTLDKLNKAKPYEMLFDGKSKFAKRAIVQSAQKPVPQDKSIVTGLPWTQGGVIESSTGKVFFTIENIGYVCSGTLLKETDTSRAIVLTAGHCVYEQEVGGGEYVTNWIFIPNFENVRFPADVSCAIETGCWGSDLLSVDSVFEGEEGYTDLATKHDWGFATIKSVNGSALPDTDITGLYPLVINGFTANGDISQSFGYPAAGKFKGSELIYCKAPISADVLNNSETWGMRCDMTGGASGGPWISNFDSSSAGVSSVNSYKYTTDRKRMYGPKFSTGTFDTYLYALSR